MRPRASLAFPLSTLAFFVTGAAQAQRPANVPQLSSRAGAAYTLYLDFAGFEFTGLWGGDAPSPATKSYAAYRNAVGGFTAAQQDEIRDVWARTAEKYAAFGVNVTTIDPAAAGLTDRQRQAFYDQTARVQHSIVTSTGAKDDASSSGASLGGFLQNSWGTAQNGGAGRGLHTNFILAPAHPNYEAAFARKSTAETIAHENGHAFGLEHQSDYEANGELRAEYSDNYNAGGLGFTVDAPNGTFAPIMGISDFTQRGLWRSGTSSPLGGAIQNDVSDILRNRATNGFYEDGIGNSFATATSLALSGASVDSSRAKGVVTPLSATDPNPLGDYQGGYFSFRTTGAALTLRATNGSSLLQAGVADPGMTLRNSLKIYNGNLQLVATASEDAQTRWTEYAGTLAAGDYYAVVTSTGGFVSARDATANYYNMGSYFLSGSGFAAPVPEPASMAALALGAGALLRRRRKSA